MNNKDCIFCKIIRKEIPSYRVYEDANYYAFLDISQFTQGHTIVIPKKHIEFVWESKEPEKYFFVVYEIANRFRSLGFKYVDSMTFGRKVPHAHIHLIPHNGEENDYKKALKGLGALQDDPSRRPGPDKAKRIANRFKLV